MPSNKSAIKRMRTSKKAQMRNKARKTELKNVEKNFRDAIAEKDVAKAEECLKNIFSKYDKASKIGVVHSNKACNKKSQLNVLLNSIR